MEIQFLYILAAILNFRLLDIVPTLLREAYMGYFLSNSCKKQIIYKTNLRKQRSRNYYICPI